MDKRIRELTRRVAMGEVTPEEADATLIREGALSQRALELAALAGNLAAREVYRPEHQPLDTWLNEFKRFGRAVRVRICAALAATTLGAWRGWRCECGHQAYLHHPLLEGCVRCACELDPPPDGEAHRALRTLESWLATPTAENALQARRAGDACVAELPAVAYAAFAPGGDPAFDWIAAVLKVSPFLDEQELRTRIAGSLGDLVRSEAFATEPTQAVQGPSLNPGTPYSRYSEEDQEDLALFFARAEALCPQSGFSVFDYEGRVPLHRSLGHPANLPVPQVSLTPDRPWYLETSAGITQLAVPRSWAEIEVATFFYATFDPPLPNVARALEVTAPAREAAKDQAEALALISLSQDPRMVSAVFRDGLGEDVPAGLSGYLTRWLPENQLLEATLDDMFSASEQV